MLMYSGSHQGGLHGKKQVGCDWGWQVCEYRFVLAALYPWSAVIVLVSVSFWVMVSSTAWGLTVTSNRHTELKQKGGEGVMCICFSSFNVWVHACVYVCASQFHSHQLCSHLKPWKPGGCHTCSPQTDISFDPSTPVTDSFVTSTDKVIPGRLHLSHLRKTHSHTRTHTHTHTHTHTRPDTVIALSATIVTQVWTSFEY